MRLFLDEAGHTGKHLFDEAQPLFVYAGVWLDGHVNAAVRENLPRLQTKHGISGEPKGSRLITSARGRRFMRESLDPLISAGLPVSVVLFDKPFQAAAVVVEDCTDYAFNDAFDERWTWDTRLKEPLARMIYDEASPKHLMAMWRARHDSCNVFVEAYATLLRGLTLSGNLKLAELAGRMARADFGEIWKVNQSAETIDVTYSPNLNAFVSIVQGANAQATRRSLDRVDVVHDEQIEYQRPLSRMFDLFRNASPGEVPLPNGNVFKLPLDRLRSLTFVPSSGSTGLQLADLVAACVRAFAGSYAGGFSMLSDVARWLLQSGDDVFPIVFASQAKQVRMFRSIIATAE